MAAPHRPDSALPSDSRDAAALPARDPYLRQLVRTVAVVAVTGIAVTVLVLKLDIFLAAFGGVLFAVLLRAATNLIGRHTPVPERWAYSTLLLLLTVLLAAGAFLLAPIVREEFQRAAEQIPEILADLEAFLMARDWGQWILQRVQDGGNGAAEGALGMVGGFFAALNNWFYYFLTAFFVGLFAAAKPALYTEGIASFFPIPRRPRILHLLHEIGYTLRWWLLGQALAMVLIGVSTGLVLGIFGVPLAVPIGVVVGLLGFIPYLGPIIGLVPVSIVAGTQGPDVLLYVLGAYTGVQLVEGYVITPLIQHRMVYLPPVFTIIAQIVLGTLVGILGFVLATPLAAVLLVLSRFYREDVLGERGVVAEGREAGGG